MAQELQTGGLSRFPILRTDDQTIQGRLVKFDNGVWTRHDGGQLQPDNPWLALATTRVLQRFVDRETIRPDSDGRLPDPDELNGAIPREQWPLDLNGQPRAPWTRQQVVYLLDVHDALMVTFLNSTAGAAIAIGELEARLRWKRALHGGQEVYPLTKLTDAPFRTNFGMRRRPDFPILGCRQFVDGQLRTVKPLSLSDELADSVPL